MCAHRFCYMALLPWEIHGRIKTAGSANFKPESEVHANHLGKDVIDNEVWNCSYKEAQFNLNRASEQTIRFDFEYTSYLKPAIIRKVSFAYASTFGRRKSIYRRRNGINLMLHGFRWKILRYRLQSNKHSNAKCNSSFHFDVCKVSYNHITGNHNL